MSTGGLELLTADVKKPRCFGVLKMPWIQFIPPYSPFLKPVKLSFVLNKSLLEKKRPPGRVGFIKISWESSMDKSNSIITDYPHIGTDARRDYLTPQGKPLSDFRWTVYDLLIKVPPGKLTTYGTLANLLTNDKHTNTKKQKTSSQAIGTALRANPFAPIVPCHRVVNSDFYIGGFFGDYGLNGIHPHKRIKRIYKSNSTKFNQVNRKIQILKKEGIEVDSNGYVIGLKEDLLWQG
ncbi:hypothetical protein O181_076174 [Austropuccinia psidii MF-1]|uniref:Methylated-DNA--protein-cysteine methyltransferase n=1 Tax=Austropuccinia psidii MF-1 TaxID=1389203 RepID=A0A9Q3FBZ8_9BASI|nr:hypothetical protein [Austropuccinia psidii MF-1]